MIHNKAISTLPFIVLFVWVHFSSVGCSTITSYSRRNGKAFNRGELDALDTLSALFSGVNEIAEENRRMEDASVLDLETEAYMDVDDDNDESEGDDIAEETDEEDGEETCHPADECVLCPGLTRSGLEGCENSGRRQKYECTKQRSGKSPNKYNVYKTCRRTIADEEYIMLQMQIVCSILGTVSLISVRKQKLANASLFEQRFMGKRRASAPSPEDGTNLGSYVQVPLTSDLSENDNKCDDGASFHSGDTLTDELSYSAGDKADSNV